MSQQEVNEEASVPQDTPTQHDETSQFDEGADVSETDQFGQAGESKEQPAPVAQPQPTIPAPYVDDGNDQTDKLATGAPVVDQGEQEPVPMVQVDPNPPAPQPQAPATSAPERQALTPSTTDIPMIDPNVALAGAGPDAFAEEPDKHRSFPPFLLNLTDKELLIDDLGRKRGNQWHVITWGPFECKQVLNLFSNTELNRSSGLQLYLDSGDLVGSDVRITPGQPGIHWRPQKIKGHVPQGVDTYESPSSAGLVENVYDGKLDEVYAKQEQEMEDTSRASVRRGGRARGGARAAT